MNGDTNSKEAAEVYKEQLVHMGDFSSAFLSNIANEIAPVKPGAPCNREVGLSQLAWADTFNEDTTPA